MKNMKGQYCIVTGGGKGIGAAIAKRFLEEEAAGVAILQRNLEVAQKTADELDPTGERVIAIKCDVANDEDCAKAIETALAKFGRIDVLVNNAGVTRDRIFHKMSDEEWYGVININLNGMYNMLKRIVPMMREQMSGNIVNIGSTSMMGNPGQCNYSATKAALIGFTASLAKEGGRKNITVNSVAPGATQTEMYDKVPEEIRQAMIASNPMQRLGQPQEIGEVIAFLASDRASFLSGQWIPVNGAK